MSEIINMLSYHFMQRALIVGVLVSLCAALLGVSLVLKRYSMIGDGLSHVGFGALAIASALGLAPLAVAVPVVVLAAVLLLRLSQNSKIKGDAAIAMISSSALAIGVVVISVTTGMNTEVASSIFPDRTAAGASNAFVSATRLPFTQPGSIGPPEQNMDGMFSRRAAISIPGTILSQFGINTRPSNGCAVAIISTESAMCSRLGRE